MKSHRRAAFFIGLVVVLVETVIIYDLWFAGSWLSPSVLSVAKTVAFVLIFIGSLVAEMQELAPRTGRLLLACILILGVYQGIVNATVNFYGAEIPAAASAFFIPFGLDAGQVKFWYAISDAAVRTLTGIIMWLVTGLVWKGVAYGEAEVPDVEQALGELAEVLASEYSKWTNKDECLAQIVQYVKDHDLDREGIERTTIFPAVWHGRTKEHSSSTKYKYVTELIEAEELVEVEGNGKKVTFAKDLSAYF